MNCNNLILDCKFIVCNTSAIYSDVIYLYSYIICCNTTMLFVMNPAQKKKVDDSGFPKDTRHLELSGSVG